jgi:hypothetical protein
VQLQWITDRAVDDAAVSLVAGDRDPVELCDLQLVAERTSRSHEGSV